MDRRKRARYAATILELGGGDGIDVDLRQPADSLDIPRIRAVVGASAFTVITAENPRGEARTDRENAAATEELRGLLGRLGRPSVPAAGRDPDPHSGHREEGFAVPGPLEPILEIARRFQQDAVFHFDGARFLLVDASDGQITPLPPPLDTREEDVWTR